jgi:hypothetical protein
MPDIRLESINYKGHPLKVGHPVRVLPSKKGGRDGYDSLVKAFFGQVVVNPTTGAKRGKVTGIEVTDPNTGATRILPQERIVPYLRSVEAKAEALRGRKKVVPISQGKAKTTRATKATGTTKATRAK